MIKHILSWNQWRKKSLNSSFYKILVLLGIQYSSTYHLSSLSDGINQGYIDGLQEGRND